MFVDDAWHKHLLRLQTNNVPVDFPLVSSLKIWLICAVKYLLCTLKLKLKQWKAYNYSIFSNLTIQAVRPMDISWSRLTLWRVVSQKIVAHLQDQ